MIRVLDAHGCLAYAATRASDVPAAFLAAPYVTAPEGVLVGLGEYLSDGVVLARPRLAAPAEATIEVGAELVLPGIPAGASVRVGEGAPVPIDDGTLTLVFPLAGHWRVEIACPRPWLDHALLVEVVDAP